MAYGDFYTRDESGKEIIIPIDELFRILLSGHMPDESTFSGIKIASGAITAESSGTTISQTPTVTAGAYSANDAVGGLLTFANAARSSGGGGVIKDVLFLDDAGQDVTLELWLFKDTFTAMADNAAWAPSQSDLRNLVAIITSDDGSWCAAGTPSACVVEVSQRYDCDGTALYGQLVTRDTPTFAATDDVTVIIGLLQD